MILVVKNVNYNLLPIVPLVSPGRTLLDFA